jgi:hypothetical protein
MRDNDSSSIISVVEFKERLGALCQKSGGRGFPRKPRDQHILFKSMTLMLEPGRDYTEKEVNEGLAKWLDEVGQAVELDHVTLRRYLVDAGYLIRDAAGRSYRVEPESSGTLFEMGIQEINPVAVVEEAYRRTEERKRDYLDKRESD